MTAAPVPRSETAQHCSLIYRSAEEFLAAAVPFLRGGISADVPVLAVLGGANRQLATEALGADAAAVDWEEPVDWYRNPTHTLHRAREYTAALGSRAASARVIGEPVWTGRSAAERIEWARFEALVNLAFIGPPMVCAYDGASLDEETLAVAHHTHPITLVGPRPEANPGYVDPVAYARRCGAAPLPTPPLDAAAQFFTDELAAVRHIVAHTARRAGFGSDRVADLVLAVNEAASNAIEYGGGRGLVRIWPTCLELICEVTSDTGGSPTPSPAASRPTRTRCVAAACG